MSKDFENLRRVIEEMEREIKRAKALLKKLEEESKPRR